MRYRVLVFVLSAVALLTFSNATQAVEVLTAEELASHCKVLPEGRGSADGEYCVRYIQGFIDGAVATDIRVMINLEAEMTREESFSQRAMRVRGRDDDRRAARYAEFCLGGPVPLREVVDKVVADLSARAEPDVELAARQIVYGSLRKHYPCKKTLERP